MSNGPKPLLTLREASELTRTSADWLKRQIDKGVLGCFRVAGKILISPEQISDFLALLEKRPRVGARGFSSFARDGVPVLTDEGWELQPRTINGADPNE